MTTVTASSPQARARTAALTRAASEKRKRSIVNAEKGIRHLTRTGEAITFRSVARAAGVSVNFLYSNSDIRHRIERLRAASQPQPSTPRQGAASADSNNIIRELSAKLATERKARHEETATLRAQLAAAHGELLTMRRAAALRPSIDR